MNDVLEGDEWKRCDNAPKPAILVNLTRAQEQARIDTAYGTGQMPLKEWRKRTDELSEPVKSVIGLAFDEAERKRAEA